MSSIFSTLQKIVSYVKNLFAFKRDVVTPPLVIKSSVASQDGTTIGYRQLGSGPGIILVHGGMKTSKDFMKLATALSDTFSVYIPDRRGRGLSGPHGDCFSVMREVEDMQAIITKTGASNIFGLSSGGLVALRTTLATSAIQKVVLYEPPFCVNGSVPTSWVSRFDSEVAQGKLAEAVITALKGTEMEPTLGILGKLPRFVLVPLMSLGLMLQKATCDNDDVSISTLIPTQHFDMQVVKEMSDTLQDYSSLQAEVLLLGGTKSPAFLKVVLDDLGSVLPHVKRITLQGLGHDGSENDGRPDLVAGELRQFFSTAAHLFSDSARPILRSPSISDQITQLLKEEGEIEEKFRTQELDRPFNKSSLTHSKPSNEISGVKNQYDEIALDKKF